jgi:hypothetical protein
MIIIAKIAESDSVTIEKYTEPMRRRNAAYEKKNARTAGKTTIAGKVNQT